MGSFLMDTTAYDNWGDTTSPPLVEAPTLADSNDREEIRVFSTNSNHGWELFYNEGTTFPPSLASQQMVDNPAISQVDAWRHACRAFTGDFGLVFPPVSNGGERDKNEFPTIEPNLTIKDILLTAGITQIPYFIKKYIKERRYSPLDEYNLKCLEQVK